MLQTTVTIRQRGQITIPDKIREALYWIREQSVISILVTPQEELIIKPFVAEQEIGIDWDDIWKRIARARLIKGKKGNLSQFIARDRESH